MLSCLIFKLECFKIKSNATDAALYFWIWNEIIKINWLYIIIDLVILYYLE